MKKEEFFKIAMESVTVAPDLTIRKEFTRNKIKEYGYSLEAGCKAVRYYYRELQKAREGEQSIFLTSGQIIQQGTVFCYLEKSVCLFMMKNHHFINLEAVFDGLGGCPGVPTLKELSPTAGENYPGGRSSRLPYPDDGVKPVPDQNKTRCESEFFTVAENHRPDQGGYYNHSGQRLFFLYNELKKEIIENITTIASSDHRSSYLMRIMKRAAGIPESLPAERGTTGVNPTNGNNLTKGDRPIGTASDRLDALSHKVAFYKTELLTFLTQLLNIEESVEAFHHGNEITRPIRPVPFPAEELRNNFDGVAMTRVYNFFERELVRQKYLTPEQLLTFLHYAFNMRELPPERLLFSNQPVKIRIIRIFYRYYKDIAGKPYAKQKKYAALLGDYFEGFETANVSTNFSK